MKIEDISDWETFLKVFHTQNFSKAARELRISVSQVSKKISRLEEKLQTRLFNRTTRSISITDEAKVIYPKIQSILEDLNEAESLFEDRQKLEGTIKITSVPFIARHLLEPILIQFKTDHPAISFDIDLSESFKDLVKDGFDMAIRIETPKDSDLIYKRLLPNKLIFCASPRYLKSSNKITSPDDLIKHQLLIMKIHTNSMFIESNSKLADYNPNPQIASDNGDFLTQLALNNHGILVRSQLDVQEHLNSKKLVQVLADFPLKYFGHIYAVVPSRRFLAPRVRYLLDCLSIKAKEFEDFTN